MAKKHIAQPTKTKTTFTVQKVEEKESRGAIKNALVHEATIGHRRRWAAWQDWVSALLGIYLILAPMLIPNAPVALFVTLGALATATAIWAGSTASSTLAEFMQALIGIVLVISPIFLGYGEARTATLNALMVGAAMIALAAVAAYRNRSGRSVNNPYDDERT